MSVRDNLMKCGKLYSLKICLWWIMKNHCFFFHALTFVKSEDIMKSTSQNLIITSNWKTINIIYGVKRNSLTPKQRRTRQFGNTGWRNCYEDQAPFGTSQAIRRQCYYTCFTKKEKDFYLVTYSLTCALKHH